MAEFQQIVLLIIGATMALTIGWLIYSQIRFRRSDTSKAHFHAHLGAEIFWGAVPVLILIILIAPATLTFFATLP